VPPPDIRPAEQLQRSDPRESQRSDLAESLKMPRLATPESTLYPGLADTTVVRAPYNILFTRRNKSIFGIIIYYYQYVMLIHGAKFCIAKFGFKIVTQN
jgi:hypothetical protein